jgi:hypothetical protein
LCDIIGMKDYTNKSVKVDSIQMLIVPTVDSTRTLTDINCYRYRIGEIYGVTTRVDKKSN